MKSQGHPKLKFTLAVAAVAATWLGLLPWVATLPSESRRWRRLKESGIDPSAMYYTELEAMRPILEQLNRRLRHEIAPSCQQQTSEGTNGTSLH